MVILPRDFCAYYITKEVLSMFERVKKIMNESQGHKNNAFEYEKEIFKHYEMTLMQQPLERCGRGLISRILFCFLPLGPVLEALS
jgi:hypothetical protein